MGRSQTNSAGKRADLGIYVRSKWEANYCRYLNFLLKHKQIKAWEYEPQEFEFTTVKRGNRFYKPDFKIWLPNGDYQWHEVKGWMDKESKVKLKRFAKHFPEEFGRLLIVTNEKGLDAEFPMVASYAEIKKWARLFSDWED